MTKTFDCIRAINLYARSAADIRRLARVCVCSAIRLSIGKRRDGMRGNNVEAEVMKELSQKPLIRAFNTDCIEFMADLPDNAYELTIVDPPYGIKMNKGLGHINELKYFGKRITNKRITNKRYHGNWDDKPPEAIFFNELLRISKNAIVWGGQFFTDKLPCSGHWIFWDKLQTMPTFGDGELAWTSFFSRRSVKRKAIEWNGLLGKANEIRIHPTQKPVALYRWLLTHYAKPGQTILDTHGGSFSSAIACWHEGDDMDIIELDKEYFEAACERFERETRQQKLFGLRG